MIFISQRKPPTTVTITRVDALRDVSAVCCGETSRFLSLESKIVLTDKRFGCDFLKKSFREYDFCFLSEKRNNYIKKSNK